MMYGTLFVVVCPDNLTVALVGIVAPELLYTLSNNTLPNPPRSPAISVSKAIL